MKVLCCTDGSEASFYAIKKTLPFINTDYRIDVCYVVDKKFLSTISPEKKDKLLTFHKNLADRILNKTAELIESKNFKVTNKYIFEGHPAAEIITVSTIEHYDLLVLGSHGKKGIKKWLGSVSQEVVMNSPCPVLVVKHTESAHEFNKNILVAVNDSDCSINAVKKFIETMDLKNASIEILTAIDSQESIPSELIMDEHWLKEFMSKETELATKTLEKFKTLFEENNIHVKSTLHLEGFVTDDIINYIEQNPIDLVVLGTHGRDEITSFLLGSVSKRVLDHSSIPVLIIPNKKHIGKIH